MNSGPPIAKPVFLVIGLAACQAACSDTPDDLPEARDASRAIILPLVREPGRQKGLFSDFQRNQEVTWNKNFWGASLGFETFTGIGWHNPQAGILITPEHVVGAEHYGVNAKGFDFYGIDGRFLGNRKAAKGQSTVARLDRDVIVIRLDSPAPEGAAVARLPDPAGYRGRLAWSKLPAAERPLLVATDWRNPRPNPPAADGKQRRPWLSTRTAHPVRLRSIDKRSQALQWDYGPAGDPAVHPSYHETVNKGDSSHPIFWVTKAGFVLASHFSSTTAGPDYGHPELQKRIQEAIEKTGGARPYRLRFAPVP